jgi:Arc/MetJ-type ribon-helix-helix transcriptional regulator
MSYQFPPDVEKAVQKWLRSGEYSSEDDILRDALKALDERQGALFEEDPVVTEGIQRGLADMVAGRSQSVEDFDQKFRAKHNIPNDG